MDVNDGRRRARLTSQQMREVAESLIAMSEEEFIAVLRMVFEEKRRHADKNSLRRECYFLGLAVQDSQNQESGDRNPSHEQWFMQAVAYVDQDEYGDSLGSDLLCQSGSCEMCNTELISTAKNVICPLCQSKDYLT